MNRLRPKKVSKRTICCNSDKSHFAHIVYVQYMFRMVFTTNSINRLDFTMETVSVYCAAGTQVLFHACSLCTCECIWESKREIENVYCERVSDFVCVCVCKRKIFTTNTVSRTFIFIKSVFLSLQSWGPHPFHCLFSVNCPLILPDLRISRTGKFPHFLKQSMITITH